MTSGRCLRCQRFPDASDKHATRREFAALVRYRANDYSVPVAFGHRDVLVRGYVDERRHKLRDRGDSPSQAVVCRRLRINPLHYLAPCWSRRPALWTRGTTCRMGVARGVRQAAASSGVEDGQERARGSSAGAQALETFPADEVHAAVARCHKQRSDRLAFKHLLLCRIEGRPPRLDLDLHPHLPSVSVTRRLAQDYMKLR